MAIPVGPVVYAVFVNETKIPELALDVELRQCWGQHDLFFVRIEYPRTATFIPSLQLWPDNSPVRIVWGRRPDNIQMWYGYVNHHSVKANADSGSKAFQVTYVCIGMSKPMNTDKTRTWGEVTPTYIARTIAGEYGMRTVVTSTDWILPYEVQSNESDFCFMNRIADKVGYRFWASNGTLYMIDPSVVLQGPPAQGVPVYYMDKRFTHVDTVRELDASQGDNIPGAAKTQRVIYGIDIKSGNTYTASASNDTSPAITQIMTDWPGEDANQGARLVQAWQNRSQFWMSATAELFGTSYLYPGKALLLQGAQLPADFSGFWIVGCVEHILKASGTTLATSDKYITRAEILRNETALTPKIKSINQVVPEFTLCSLFNGVWRSNNMSIIYDGVQGV
jgi:phage protein D